MRWLKNNKWTVIVIACIAVAITFLVLFVRYIRKQNQQMQTNPNIQAFLHMIRYAEGTSGANGYRTLFGGQLFHDYSTHPNVRVPYKNTYSTAAGAYQILYKTWLHYKIELGLKDFSPESQDRIAIELIRENGGLDYILAGNFDKAVYKVRKVWASMPNAGYGQPEKSLTQLRKVYTDNGGLFA